ncbi:MAG: hypothetical protein J0L62_04305 [Bacteroidetes bacterium]|nr:hypothetical protein [Bacteroidota bacterium]
MGYFNRIYLLIFFTCLPLISFAQTEISGFQNLLISSDATYLGSAQSNSALITNSQSLFLHSYISRSDAGNQDISFGYQNYIGDLKHISLTSRFLFWNQPIQLGWQKLSADGIEFRDKPGDSKGSFEAYWMTFAAGTTFQWDQTDIGVTLKYSQQRLFLDENFAIAGDFSVSHPVMRDYSLQYVSLQNLGSASKIGSQTPNLPLQLKSGWIFYDFSNAQKQFRVQIVNEMSWLFHGNRFVSNIGAETTIFETFSLRGGYRINHDSNPFSFGTSFSYGSMKIAYSFSYYSTGLNSGHALGYSWQL